MKVAIVGALGKMGKLHTDLLKDDHDLVLIDQFDQFDFKVDAAIIASPSGLHANHATKYILNSVPVLIEKPIALTMGHAKFIRALAENVQVPVAVGYLERFNPLFHEREQAIWNSSWIHIERDGVYNEQYGSLAVDLLSHDIDLLRFMFGKRLACKVEYDRHNCAMIVFDVEDGPDGVIFSTAGGGYRHWITDDFRIDFSQPTPGVNKLSLEHEAFFKFINGQPSDICTIDDAVLDLADALGETN